MGEIGHTAKLNGMQVLESRDHAMGKVKSMDR